MVDIIETEKYECLWKTTSKDYAVRVWRERFYGCDRSVVLRVL